MAETERTAPSDTAAEYLEDIARMREDLGAVTRPYARSKGFGFCVHTKVEDTFADVAWLFEHQPTARTPLLARIKELTLLVETVGQPKQ